MAKIVLVLLIALIAMYSGSAVLIENEKLTDSGQTFLNEGTASISMLKDQQTYVNHRSAHGPNMQYMHMSRYNRMIPVIVPSFNSERIVVQDPRITVRDDVLDRDELPDFLRQNTPELRGISHFQEYVTPYEDAIQSYLEGEGLEDKYDIYETAISWVWVSDLTLTGRQEEWLTPSEFLYDTPEYSSNPLSGTIVSDCEDQANTLASLLIASGEYNEGSVRVVIGEVSFGDVTGGHAWVEVYEDGQWFPLDATVGPYYDDDSEELIVPDISESDYYYFRDEGYTVLEIWYYYNNEYFIDLENDLGNAPDNWMSISSSYS